jgi:thioredoxin-related protein
MIKKITLALFVAVFSLQLTAQEINWVTFEEATALQKKNPKKIMMDVYTVWCGPCKMLDRITFKNKDLVAYVNKYYYAVKFNAEGDAKITYKDKVLTNPNYDMTRANSRNATHDFARFLQVNAFPTIVFFDEELRMIAPIRGYQNPQQLELYLKLFKGEAYKEMKTQEAFTKYYEAFVPTFKD